MSAEKRTVLRFQSLVGDGCKCGADQRADNEHPEAGQRRGVAGQSRNQRRSEAARRIYRCACEINAENMYERERKSYHKTGNRAVFNL